MGAGIGGREGRCAVSDLIHDVSTDDLRQAIADIRATLRAGFPRGQFKQRKPQALQSHHRAHFERLLDRFEVEMAVRARRSGGAA